jgi:hypothetical protein
MNNWNPVPNTTTIGTPDVLASVALPRNILSAGAHDIFELWEGTNQVCAF